MASIRAKANAHHTCQECGSTELIQAHHEIPGDDNSLIALCAECHSKRHPDVPKALFFSTNIQPYWHNKSASSLAKELSVCSRTVIRAARKFKVNQGRLSDGEETLIKTAIMHHWQMLPTDLELLREKTKLREKMRRELRQIKDQYRIRIANMIASTRGNQKMHMQQDCAQINERYKATIKRLDKQITVIRKREKIEEQLRSGKKVVCLV